MYDMIESINSHERMTQMNNNARQDELLIVQIEYDVAVLQLNRHDKLNALNSHLVGQLINELIDLEQNPDVKVIILTGVNKSFIVGADINEMKDMDARSAKQFITRLHTLLDTIRQLNKPVIAGVNGYCYGAGLELAISCDMSIISDRATFGMQEVQLGIPSVIEAALLPFVIGLPKTRELLLTGEVVDSAAAKDMGLVNHVVNHDDLEKQCMHYALKMANNSAHALTLQKQLINRWLENAGVDQSIKNGIDSFALAFTYDETNKLMQDVFKK